MRAAAKAANRPPTVAANATTLLEDNEADPAISRATGGRVTPGGRVVPGGKKVGAAEGADVGMADPKSSSREPAVGMAVGTMVGATLGAPVNTVGAMLGAAEVMVGAPGFGGGK